ncbi:E3 ubiquitin-protein ligase TRIM71 [Bienertia sinuspersici]
MSTVIKLDNMDAYVLHNMMPDRDATNDKPPLLGRSIVSGATKWKSNTATGNGLKMFCLDMETFSNFVKFATQFMFLFTLMTRTRTSYLRFVKAVVRQQTHSIPWLDLYKLGGLPISGRIYDEAVPDIHTLCAHTDKGIRRIPKAYESLFATYRQIVQRPESKRVFLRNNGWTFGVRDQLRIAFLVQGSKFFKDVKARRVIHEGSGAKVGCTMLNKNKNIFLFDDGNSDHTQMSYLSSLRSGYVSLLHYDSFFIEPYLPYRFSRQSGFCQDIPSAITRKVQDHSNVSYENVLMFWKLLLFQDWHKLKTVKFHGWWTTVTIKDFRHNIDKLFSAVESSSPNLKRVSPHNESRDAHRSANGHASQHEGTSDNVFAAPPKRLHLIGVLDEVEGEDKSTSDAESEINFKHQRWRRSKKPRTADLEGDERDFRGAFQNIPIPSDIPIDLTQVGDMYFEMGASFNIDDAMIGEATEPLNVLTDRPNPGKGKDIHMERDLVERSNPASPVKTHHSVDGPSTFKINARTLGIPLDAKGIPRAPSHGDAVPTLLISTIHVTPASQGIFTSAIRILGNEYLTLLKQTPFDKVSDRHGEAPQVYKAIRVMHGDPEPLKCMVDEYVWSVKSHLALKASLSDRRRSDQVEEERLAVEEELRLAESSYDTTLTKHKGLEEEGAALKKKEDELLKELEDVRQRMDQVANDLGDNRNSLTTLEATMHATKKRVEELEAVPVCNAEEMELFDEQERKLLEFQPSLDSSDWIV